MLGIQGNKAFKRDADWREYMRNWAAPQSMESRISGLLEKNLFPPTDAFIASLAQKYGMTYTKGKKGEERFYSDDEKPIYPPNDGAVGTAKTITLKAGMMIDRYGWVNGSYTSPKGVSYGERALSRTTTQEYHVYRILKDIENVQEAEVAPWFGQPGGGIQYKLPRKISDLTEYLEEVQP